MGGNVEKAAELEAQGKYNKILRNIEKTRSAELFLIFELVSNFLESFNEDSLLTAYQHDDVSELKIILRGLGF